MVTSSGYPLCARLVGWLPPRVVSADVGPDVELWVGFDVCVGTEVCVGLDVCVGLTCVGVGACLVEEGSVVGFDDGRELEVRVGVDVG